MCGIKMVISGFAALILIFLSFFLFLTIHCVPNLTTVVDIPQRFYVFVFFSSCFCLLGEIAMPLSMGEEQGRLKRTYFVLYSF